MSGWEAGLAGYMFDNRLHISQIISQFPRLKIKESCIEAVLENQQLI